MRNQTRIPNLIRENQYSRLHPEIKRIINATSIKFDVSKSFVVATALADYFKVRNHERYYLVQIKRRTLHRNKSKRA